MSSPSLPLIRPVILSGGSGTRLWPISRQQYPKQFAPLIGEVTLFAATLKRIGDRKRYAAPIIVSNIEHKFFVLEALDQLGIDDATVLLEPVGRNTAAAALTAALLPGEAESGLLHLVMPSDQLVTDQAAFDDAVALAAKTAKSGSLVLFGITPDRPETGFGYIVPAKGKDGVRPIAMFTEKPDAARAAQLIKEGALWNSGMFLYSPAVLAAEAETLAPAHFAQCRLAVDAAAREPRFSVLGTEAYAEMESHPFDKLIMERTKNGAVLPCQMGWSDVGSWEALWQLSPKDAGNNAVLGPVVTKDVKSSYLRSEGPAVAVLGMEDCMVVATKDAVLVAPCSRSQEIKGLLALVENDHRDITTNHALVQRPWGSYEGVADGTNFLVKHIVVKPGRSLSLQMHHHRAEHWIVVAGTARIECNGVEKLLFANESTFIPQGATHRLSNPGKIDLQLIEVQSGEYLREDDIVRFEDMYGRVAKTA